MNAINTIDTESKKKMSLLRQFPIKYSLKLKTDNFTLIKQQKDKMTFQNWFSDLSFGTAL